MAYQSVWYFTNFQENLVSALEQDLVNFNVDLSTALTYSGVDLKRRDSKTTFIPSTHWSCGFCYHYVLKANRENFKYDISGFDNEMMQYTSYSEGEYYNWHTDSGLLSEDPHQRKLSIIVQLSDPSDYRGGEVQIMSEDGSMMVLPKVRGSVIVFDSRTRHRVRKVESGVRKSLVGWVVGPKWK